MNLQTVPLPDGETVAFITLYGVNRSSIVTEWHQRVMVGHWGLPVNYIQCPFDLGVSHGTMMNQVLAETIDQPNAPDYYWWWDNDCILLRRELIDDVLSIVANKRTLWGQAWNSMHVKGPNGSVQHPYASQACCCLSRKLYNTIGRPSCDWTPRGDTLEEVTYLVEEKGLTLALQYPSSSDEPYTVSLSQSCRYGRSIAYDSPVSSYHETRADLPGASDRFVAMAKRVIVGEFDA